MRDIKNPKNWSFETKQVHAGQEQPDPATGARAVPIYATTSYVFENCRHGADLFALKESGNIYSRLTNPTRRLYLNSVLPLWKEVREPWPQRRGAAAITYAFQALAKAGEHIVAAENDLRRNLQSAGPHPSPYERDHYNFCRSPGGGRL